MGHVRDITKATSKQQITSNNRSLVFVFVVPEITKIQKLQFHNSISWSILKIIYANFVPTPHYSNIVDDSKKKAKY